MRLIYLCTVDPPPPYSDFTKVQEFFEVIPSYLRPRTSTIDSPHMLFFADRIGSNWKPEFHDFAIVFLSERMLTDPTALACLGRAKLAFPNMVGIDLYNNLTSSLQEKAKAFTKRVFYLDEGKEFLITTFPDIAAAYDLEIKELNESIEEEGYQYLDKTINDLEKRSNANRNIAYGCYIAAGLLLTAILVFTYQRFCVLNDFEIQLEIQYALIQCIETIVLFSLVVAFARFLFLLGKSFMVESIRFNDRAHAIGLGRLYLKLYKGKFKWDELRDVLQNWNIDEGSSFRHLDAKDLEPISVDKALSVLKK